MTEETQPPQGFTRRRLFGAAAVAGGAAVAATALPPNVQKALAAPLPGKRPELGDIKHVVLLMQENRSFDHYFGTMSGVAGYSDPHAITLSTGRSVFYQPDPRIRTATCSRSTSTATRRRRSGSRRPETTRGR